jgi:metallo-beta-lactamase class B
MKHLIFIFLLACARVTGVAQIDHQETIKITDDLEVIRISDHAWVHVSWTDSPEFGRFSSNGLVFVNQGSAFLFDTPSSDYLTSELNTWILTALHAEIVAFVPNHWHEDCIGGLNFLKSIGVKSYASQKTIEITKSMHLPVPDVGFSDTLQIKASEKFIGCYYFGAGHSLDNIVVWFPSEKILFAGCMVKSMNSNGLGNTVDGDLSEWPKTIDKVIKKFTMAETVIPGHGPWGGKELLLHTRELLKVTETK